MGDVVQKNLVIFSDHEWDRAFAKHLAEILKLPLVIRNKAEELGEDIKAGNIGALIVDTVTDGRFNEFENYLQKDFGLFSDRIEPNQYHFIVSKELTEFAVLAPSPIFGSSLTRMDKDPESAARMYAPVVKKNVSAAPFGLEAYFEGTKAKVQKVQLVKASQKQEAVEAVRNYVAAAKFQSRMASTIANAADEILMNAIFDAPVDEMGVQVLKDTVRSTDFDLKDQSEVTMQIGFDGEVIAITATDRWGSIDKPRLLTHISKLFSNNEFCVRIAGAGAGIGLGSVFKGGGSFLFTSLEDERTEVTVFFRKFDSYKDFKEQFRFMTTLFYYP